VHRVELMAQVRTQVDTLWDGREPDEVVVGVSSGLEDVP
jgi:hypothetical protein